MIIRKQLHKLVDQLPEYRLNSALKYLRLLLTDAEPNCLYHYTKPEGLFGIFDSKTIWAKQYCYLNDSSELLIAKKLVKIRRKALDLKVDLGPLENDLKVYVSIFSLCSEWNLLSQWRAYCPTGGYAIGFDVKKLRTLISKRGKTVSSGPNFLLSRCVYNEEEQKDLVDTWLRKNQSGPGELINLNKFIQEVGLSIKHHGFEEEHEWRIISRIMSPLFDTTNETYHTRWRERGTNNYSVFSFMAINLRDDDGLLPIREIVVGPCRDMKKAIRFVDERIREVGMEDRIAVRKTDIPYTVL
jgi:hypothetical protein